MIFIHVPQGDLTFNTLREFSAHIGASIPADATAATIAPFGAYFVAQAAEPVITSTQVAELSSAVTHANGVSTQDWTTRDKTTEEIAAETLAYRETLVARRGDFAIACRQAGVITGAESNAWGPGNSLPAKVQAAITAYYSDPATLAVTDQGALDDALTEALSATTIRRVHPIVDLVRAALNITETEADDIFTVAMAREQAI